MSCIIQITILTFCARSMHVDVIVCVYKQLIKDTDFCWVFFFFFYLLFGIVVEVVIKNVFYLEIY